MPYPSVKFDKNHDGEVDESVPVAVLEIRPESVQKRGPDQPKIVLSQF